MRRKISSAFVLKVARKILQALGFSKRTVLLEIILLPPRELKKINSRYRGKNRTTTVLSFGASSDFPDQTNLLGEVLLCPEEIFRGVEKGKRKQELTRFLLHGILHLIGENHFTKSARLRMEGREKALMRKL
ncbi:MAG: rRNA maturation RNase YbeY [Parcubacteria group bacterium]|nr:rRNA maturation RNase YbeY [Parcubacteria group bacterium]